MPLSLEFGGEGVSLAPLTQTYNHRVTHIMPTTTNQKNIKVFISYRNIPLSQQEGDFLANALKSEAGYEVFIDTQELKNKGGVKWAETIYDNIHTSDVLIVLLEQETHFSEWVQREIDVARGAHVSILPIAIIQAQEIAKVLRDVQEKLAISEMQFLFFSSQKPNTEPIIESIESLSKRTRDAQKSWVDNLRERRYALKASITDPVYRTYQLLPNKTICLASGDMTEMQGLDVLVNTENNYMQMARIYESGVLSSVLRREGSLLKNGKILEDSVQIELDDQILHGEGLGSRPIEIEQVIPTHAGHPRSTLAKNGARFIFHASTVYVHPRNRSVTPIKTDANIHQTVLNCLNLFLEVHQNRGIISPPDSPRYPAEQKAAETYQPLKSIIFPLFGAGQGGRATIEVAPPMIKAFKSFLLKHKNTPDFPLESIHLCVFSEVDIAIVESIMNDICTP